MIGKVGRSCVQGVIMIRKVGRACVWGEIVIGKVGRVCVWGGIIIVKVGRACIRGGIVIGKVLHQQVSDLYSNKFKVIIYGLTFNPEFNHSLLIDNSKRPLLGGCCSYLY